MSFDVQFPGLGLEFTINRVALSIGGLNIYWYGVCIAVGMCLALVFAFRHSVEFGVDADSMVDVILIGINSDRLIDVILVGAVMAIVCARIYYIVFAPFKYESIWQMIDIRQGGIAIYGAVIGAFVFGGLMAKIRRIPILPLFDLVGICFLIGQGVGRWGNFMNREAHGAVTDTFLKMGLQDASGVVTYYHPTFLYESVWNLVGFIGLHFFSKKRKFDGEVFLAYVAWYGLGRVWIEGLRTDSLYLFSTGIRVSQLVAAVSFLAAAGILAWVLVKKKPARESLYVNRKREEPQADEKQDD